MNKEKMYGNKIIEKLFLINFGKKNKFVIYSSRIKEMRKNINEKLFVVNS